MMMNNEKRRWRMQKKFQIETQKNFLEVWDQS